MSDFRTVLTRLEVVSDKHGWTLAVGDRKQDEPEQWILILTKADPAKVLFGGDLGVAVSDGLGIADKFGGEQ